MSKEIYGVDGKLLSTKMIKSNGFDFDVSVLESDPFVLMMTLICLDPTDKQKDLLAKLNLTLKDSKDNIIFPAKKVEKEVKKESEPHK